MFTGALVGVAVIQLLTFSEQARIMEASLNVTSAAVASSNEANSIARVALASQYRPWIQLHVVGHEGLKIEENEIRLTVHFTAKNFGKTPALRAFIKTGSQITYGDQMGTRSAQEALVTSMESHIGDGFFTNTIFPDQTEKFSAEIYINPTQIGKYLTSQTVKDVPIPFILFSGYGAIQYEGVGSADVFHTGFSFSVSGFDPAHPQMRRVIEFKEGVVPANRIVLDNMTDAPIIK
jgi:hypothetical protein